MNQNSVCEWYTDEIKKLNSRIWYPHNIVHNDTIIYPFNSKIISHESFKNNDNNNDMLTIKNDSITYEQKYTEIHFNARINKSKYKIFTINI